VLYTDYRKREGKEILRKVEMSKTIYRYSLTFFGDLHVSYLSFSQNDLLKLVTYTAK